MPFEFAGLGVSKKPVHWEQPRPVARSRAELLLECIGEHHSAISDANVARVKGAEPFDMSFECGAISTIAHLEGTTSTFRKNDNRISTDWQLHAKVNLQARPAAASNAGRRFA